MRRVLPVLLAGAALLEPNSARAQRKAGSSAADSDTTRTPAGWRAGSNVVTFAAEPMSFHVVRVPLPSSMLAADTVRIDIRPEPVFVLVGAQRMVLTASGHPDILLALGVSAQARAGSQPAAHVTFSARGTRVMVPLEARVAPLHRIVLAVEPATRDFSAGEHVDLRLRVRSFGNATDSVQLHVEAPEGWGVSAYDSTAVVAAGDSLLRAVRLAIPRHSATGAFFVRTTARSPGSNASVLTTISVAGAHLTQASPGPMAHLSVGTVAVENGPAATVGQLAVSGALASGIYLDGRISTEPPTTTTAVRGLARLGTYATPSQLAAWSPDWRLVLGSTLADLGDVVGINAGGRGLDFTYDDGRSSYQILAARPLANGIGRTDGSIFGAQLARRLGIASIGGSVSRFRSAGLQAQSISAYGVDLSVSPGAALRLNSTVAYRDFEYGTGIGWSVQVAREEEGNHAQLGYVRAPGGSGAFARAENELTASFSRAITDRYEVSASYFRSTDANAAATDIRSNAANLVQQYRLTDWLTLRAHARSARFDVNGHPFAFGNGEQLAGVGAVLAARRVTYSAGLELGQLTRDVTANGISVHDAGRRMAWRGSAFRALSFGSFYLEGSYERNDPGTGHVPEQTIVRLRADHAQLPFAPRNLSFDGEIGYDRWSGMRAITSYHAGLNYLLPPGTQVSAVLERNPLFYATTGSSPMVFALRVDQAIGLPGLARGPTAGIVFQDLNGNGRRDGGEPGMANIGVYSGAARTITGHDGRFRFGGPTRGRVTVDPTTLPYGWMVDARAGGNRIALVPTSAVQVVLQLGAAERLRGIDLSHLVVMARDDGGRSWLARRTSPETAVFEALPVGSYAIEVDFSAVAEPLTLDGPTPRVKVTRDVIATVEVRVAGRPLRFKQDQQEDE